ncbi:zinc finger transcription factor 1, partial [Metarhizium brunneum ARSEF 3297]
MSSGVPAERAFNEDSPMDIGIPAPLVSKLVDSYFSNFFYATLLLHPPTFREDLVTGRATKHVVLGVCAVASGLCPDSGQDAHLLNEGASLEWAEKAQALVFAHLAVPKEENLVTLLNLTLFWYRLGQWQRSFLLGTNLFCAARMLNFPDSVSSMDNTLPAETSRRRFWACYILSRLGGMLDGSNATVDALARMPLPQSEQEFGNGTLSEKLIKFENSERNGSFFAEVIRVGSICFTQNAELDIEERLSNMQTLDIALRKWRNGLPDMFAFNSTNLEHYQPSEVSQILLINILFHQSLCVLHASIIPLFTFCRIRPGCEDAQIRSAQTAFDHAQHISSLLQKCMASHSEGHWGFIGYSAYCSSAIQLPFLWCQSPDVAAKATANIKTNAQVMRRTGKHWKLISGLEKHLRSLRRYHEVSGYSLQDEPCNVDAAELNRCSGSFDRTRTSVLGHNDIIWKYGQMSECGEIVKLEVDSEVGGLQEDGGLACTTTDLPSWNDIPIDVMDDFLAPFCINDDLESFLAGGYPY